MFTYRLPDGGINSSSYINAEGQIKFDPPVYEQRYTTVTRILEDECWANHIKKIVDFGCAEMRLLPLLRRIKNIEHIIEVDIDETILQTYQSRAEPLVSDYLQKRESPLRVEIFRGSIDVSDRNLQNVDAVIAVEVIEHLCPDVLEKVPQNIFGFIQPKLAIFSTPNSEFNVLFEPLHTNGFRHLDHKFEWTRSEFKKWTMDICKRYKNYSVFLMGVGKPPPDHKNIGFVTQIAIFARNDIINKPTEEQTAVNISTDQNPDMQYKKIYAVDFPFYNDLRTKEQKILDEAHYHIDRARRIDYYFNRERGIYQMPIALLMSFTASVGSNEQELRDILKRNKIEVEEDFIVLPELDENDLTYRQIDDCYDDIYGWNDDLACDAENVAELSGGRNSSTVVYDSEENWD